MKNIRDTIFSQYANSPNILTLISEINDAIDPQYFLDDFYNLVYRLSTARGFALDIWAQKVGVSRTATILYKEGDFFGFKTGYEPFNTYPFATSTGSGSSYLLPDSMLRQLIIIKAARNIVYATAININKFLQLIFEGKRAYYKITGHMQAKYVFEFELSAFERFMVYNLNILPAPCGVQIEFSEEPPVDPFGFDGSDLNNFNNGVFYNG